MTEKRFEDHIENYLLNHPTDGLVYHAVTPQSYDRTLGVVSAEFVTFLQNSQPKAYEQWVRQFGELADEKLVKRLSLSLQKHGAIKVLREGIRDRGVYIDTFITKPSSGLNPEHQAQFLQNRLSVVRQLRYSLSTEKSIDMVLFLNGIPIVSIELKNQLSGQSIVDGIRQFQFDRDPKNEPLLQFKRMLVHFVVDNDTVGMTTKLNGEDTRFLPYNKDIVNPTVAGDYKVSYLWKEVLTPASIIDIIENFVLETSEKEKSWDSKLQKVVEEKKHLLIFPRYHQLDVIRKLQRTVKQEGTGNNYLIQHTTGSGKSYSIGWLSYMLNALYQSSSDTNRIFDNIIVITDRKVLDKQLRTTIINLQQEAGTVTAIDKNSAQLKEALEKTGGDIIISTIQKFGVIYQTISELKGRTFAIIVDEVHSSQSGESAKKLKQSLAISDESGDEEPEDYEELLLSEIRSRAKQPHISFFGFTGTPKNKTLELFGRKTPDGTFKAFHSYSMKQSIAEGYTLDVLKYFASFSRWFKLRTNEGSPDEELPENQVKEAAVKYADNHAATIQQKVHVMLKQFTEHTHKKIGGKARAMVVVRSRMHCVLYQQEMLKQMKDLRLPYSCLVAFSGSIELAKEQVTENSLNAENGLGSKVSIPDGLKDPRFRILIVSNKYQTGFDEPLMHTMFVDKRLGGVQCVQTLSRLNRTTKGKTDTFVLDFINKPDEIITAFQPYYTTTELTGETDSYKLYQLDEDIRAYNIFTSYEVDEFCKLFLAKTTSDAALQQFLNEPVRRWSGLSEETHREEFKSLINSYCRLYSYISQIIDYEDINLEKLFIFLSFLRKKLPKRKGSTIDISDEVNLDSLRIQKIGEMNLELEDRTGELAPISEGTGGGSGEEETEYLSEIIKKVNDRFGMNLSEEDKIRLNNVYKRIISDEQILKVMQGDNSESNKRQFFEESKSKIVLEYLNDNFEFYKNIESSQHKAIITDIMYQQFKRGNT